MTERAWGPDRKSKSDAAFVAALDAIDEAIKAHSKAHERATGALGDRLSGLVRDIADDRGRPDGT